MRRLSNSVQTLGSKERTRVVDGYTQKLFNSGYEEHQVKRILVMGFENKKLILAKL